MDYYKTEPTSDDWLEEHWQEKICRRILTPLKVMCWLGLATSLGLFIMDHFRDNKKERSQFTAIPTPLPEDIIRTKALPELTTAEYWQLRNVQAALDSLREGCYVCYDKLIDFHTGSEEELGALLETYEQQENDKLLSIASSLDSLGQICPTCYEQFLSRYIVFQDSLKQIITLHQEKFNRFKSNQRP